MRYGCANTREREAESKSPARLAYGLTRYPSQDSKLRLKQTCHNAFLTRLQVLALRKQGMPSSTRKLQLGRTLPEICLTLHMSNTGASDPLPIDLENELLDIVITAALTWEEGLPSCKAFDNAVLQLVKATTRETNLKRKKLLEVQNEDLQS